MEDSVAKKHVQTVLRESVKLDVLVGRRRCNVVRPPKEEARKN